MRESARGTNAANAASAAARDCMPASDLALEAPAELHDVVRGTKWIHTRCGAKVERTLRVETPDAETALHHVV